VNYISASGMHSEKANRKEHGAGSRVKNTILYALSIIDGFVKSRHSHEGGNSGTRNFLKRMDSRLRTPDNEFRGQASGMTVIKRTFCDVVIIFLMLFAPCSLLFAGIKDRVVAFVDAQAITFSELEMKFIESRKVKTDITKEEVLNTMINRVLLLREAKKIRLEAPSEEELLREYIDMKIRALIRVKEEEIHDYYNKHIENFEGKELEDMRDDIENYLIEHDLNERLKSHINELKEKTCVRIQLNSE
jgi:hypothetical protein